jgi:hypothetical protein
MAMKWLLLAILFSPFILAIGLAIRSRLGISPYTAKPRRVYGTQVHRVGQHLAGWSFGIILLLLISDGASGTYIFGQLKLITVAVYGFLIGILLCTISVFVQDKQQ